MPLALQTFSTVPEASAALKSAGSRYIGGGTLVVRAANEGDLSIGSFVRSTDATLTAVSVSGGDVTLGASVTMARIMRERQLAPIAAAARAVGGPAIRNMATVGGNLFAPSPYGDFAVALMALDASADIRDTHVPMHELLARREGCRDIVTAVRFKLPMANSFRFVKVSRVKPKGVSVLSIAAVLETGPDGVVRAVRIALGCMADRPMRATAAEAALVGARLTAEGIARAVAAIGKGTSPITDPIASAWYRSQVLPVHFRRLLLA